MRIVFAGSPGFVLPTLRAALDSGHSVVAVYTAPDKPAGRGLKIQDSEVKAFAKQHAIPVEQPASFDVPAQQTFAQYQADLFVVMAYGLLLPQAVLNTPRYACLNLHLSLLPRWRGAAPVVRAIEAGDRNSGVCLMKMVEQLDAGPIVSQESVEIGNKETAVQLYDKLSAIAAKLLTQFLDQPDHADCLARATPQDAAAACYANKLSKEEAWIDWQQPALRIEQKIRAFAGWPVAQTQLSDDCLRIWAAEVAQATGGTPGTVLEVSHQGVLVACGEGSLWLREVQLQGNKRMDATSFANGHPLNDVCFTTPAR